MCDCRISASKWDLSVYHEGAAALQLSEISRSDGHNHYLRFPAVMVTIKAVTLSNIFENFYSLWACFCCLCFVLSCHLPPPSRLPMGPHQDLLHLWKWPQSVEYLFFLAFQTMSSFCQRKRERDSKRAGHPLFWAHKSGSSTCPAFPPLLHLCPRCWLIGQS